MKRMIALLGGAFVAAGLTIAAFAEGEHKESEAGKQVTVTGELIDTACFVTSDGDAKGQDHAECAQVCMASGIPAGILPEGSKDAHGLMYLLTNPTVLAPHAAKTIKVEGKEYGDLHAIDPQKVYVKEGDEWKEVQLKDEHHNLASAADTAQPDAPKDKTSGHGKHKH